MLSFGNCMLKNTNWFCYTCKSGLHNNINLNVLVVTATPGGSSVWWHADWVVPVHQDQCSLWREQIQVRFTHCWVCHCLVWGVGITIPLWFNCTQLKSTCHRNFRVLKWSLTFIWVFQFCFWSHFQLNFTCIRKHLSKGLTSILRKCLGWLIYFSY